MLAVAEQLLVDRQARRDRHGPAPSARTSTPGAGAAPSDARRRRRRAPAAPHRRRPARRSAPLAQLGAQWRRRAAPRAATTVARPVAPAGRRRSARRNVRTAGRSSSATRTIRPGARRPRAGGRRSAPGRITRQSRREPAPQQVAGRRVARGARVEPAEEELHDACARPASRARARSARGRCRRSARASGAARRWPTWRERLVHVAEVERGERRARPRSCARFDRQRRAAARAGRGRGVTDGRARAARRRPGRAAPPVRSRAARSRRRLAHARRWSRRRDDQHPVPAGGQLGERRARRGRDLVRSLPRRRELRDR